MQKRQQANLLEQKRIYSDFAGALTLLLVQVDQLALAVGNQKPLQTKTKIEQCLEAIEIVFRHVLQMKNTYEMNLNIMRVDDFQINDDNREHFKEFGMPNTAIYEKMLTPLTASGDIAKWHAIHLPVPRANQAAYALPGAPLALLQKEPQLCDLKRLMVSPQIPSALRGKVQTYFRSKKKAVRYLLSIPLPAYDGKDSVGVVNVELPDVKPATEINALVTIAVNQSSPYMMLLNKLLA